MLAPGILNVDNLEMIEPSYMALADARYTSEFLSLHAAEGRMLVDEEEDPIAVAVRSDSTWKVSSFLLRPPAIEVIEMLEQLDLAIIQVEGEEWAAAVREYYALRLARTTPAFEDFNPERKDMIRSLLRESLDDVRGLTCLDCGCGSGIGTMAARERGMWALGFDNDAAMLSLGLQKGRLVPEDTALVDGTMASRYLEPADVGLMLMAGSINDFNAFVWKQVTEQMLILCGRLLCTTETRPEAERILGWCEALERKGEVRENRRHAFYDRWVVTTL
jgi:hypothetical protein